MEGTYGTYRNPGTARKKSKEEADDIEDRFRRQEAAKKEARRNAEEKTERRRKKQEAQRAAAGARGEKGKAKTKDAGNSAPPPPPPRFPSLFTQVALGRTSDLLLLGAKVDTHEAIRSAYLKSALCYHPDKNRAPDAAEQFKRIQAAYERLTGDS